jgi:hypothetical protein
MNWVRSELLTLKSVADHQKSASYCHHFHQDYVARMHSNFFEGMTDWCLVNWPNHSRETLLSKKEEEIMKFTNPAFPHSPFEKV